MKISTRARFKPMLVLLFVLPLLLSFSTNTPHDTLVKLNEEFLGGRLNQEIEQGITGKDRDAAVEWAKIRFGRA
ncbi:MAG: hypothetical protein AAB354_02780, partial [candidate division KSB1 bacterium]